MPIILPRHDLKQRTLLRDVRPASVRFAEYMGQTSTLATGLFGLGGAAFIFPDVALWAELCAFVGWFYWNWVEKRKFFLPFKMPKYCGIPDAHNPAPGKKTAGKPDGILFLGNLNDADDPRNGQELWLTNNDARTHIVYLGTTGSGKTEGLKSIVSNALTWGSGFVYVDGKADTDLWASLYALARRFGRDDDLLVLNYMTANSDDGAMSNSMNPFANGSASYLANMIISLMPDAGGDNAMWKERAVALMFALMPALTWKRDKQNLLLDVGVVREYIELSPIIRLSRDPNLPERIVRSLQGYLNTLPGFVDAAFDDEGNERPPSPDQPMYDLQVARQQHGYLSMQFTRSLQSLADEYGYIFKVQLADVDVLDVVLNRRILVALIPALEKSGDEAANLGKIIVANLKGMMGMTLGNTVEGSWENAIGSKQTRSSSSFMAVFDEVGYYTAPGMAVMAAQARSLGFSLVFAAQDIPSMEKRIKAEAQSILGNCNLKIFGKIEDPLETKNFLEKTTPTSWILESNGMSAPVNTVSSLFMSMPFYDNRGTGGTANRPTVTYDHLRSQREGEAHMFFLDWPVSARVLYAAPEKVRALRVHRFLPIPASTTSTANRERTINEMVAHFRDPEWKAATAAPNVPTPAEIAALSKHIAAGAAAGLSPLESAVAAVAGMSKLAPKAPAAKTGEPPLPGKASSGGRASAPISRQPAAATSRGGRTPQSSMQQDDEYAIDEMETFPVSAQQTRQSPVAAARSSGNGATSSVAGFRSNDLDVSVVTRPGEDDSDIIDVTKFQLPAEIAAMIEQSADRLNKGMAD